MKRVAKILGPWCAVAVMLTAVLPASAQQIKKNGELIFQTGFELDTPGLSPGEPPIGNWLFINPGNPDYLGVLDASSEGPGPAVGNNYLKMYRPDGDTGVYTRAGFDQPIVAGDLLEMDLYLWLDKAADYNFFMGFESEDLSSRLWLATSATPGAEPGHYRPIVNMGNAPTDLIDITFQLQTWQHWSISWVVGSNEATFSIDDQVQTRTVDAGDFETPISEARVAISNWPDYLLYIDSEQAPVLAGDVNFDGIVNGQDIALIATNWLITGADVQGDANRDGIVNGQDIAIVATNWLATSAPGEAQAVPEPSTMVLGVLGVAALVVGHRRTTQRRQQG